MMKYSRIRRILVTALPNRCHIALQIFNKEKAKERQEKLKASA